MRLNWVNALKSENADALLALEERMGDYYRNCQYYEDIHFGLDVWKSGSPYYAHIIKAAREAEAVMEAGCGESGILQVCPFLMTKYTGIDFSEKLMSQNRLRFPNADFRCLEEPYKWPFEDDRFDLVFSVFVLEHVVRPQLFLNEAMRVMKKGGRLIIQCPDYYGYQRMASQRLGRGPGTGREKLLRGKILDALVTGWETRIELPRAMRSLRRRDPGAFWINLDPICFYDSFRPDVDAVFVTDQKALVNHLRTNFNYIESSETIKNQCANDRFLFLEFEKK